jgi:hypothetical protein
MTITNPYFSARDFPLAMTSAKNWLLWRYRGAQGSRREFFNHAGDRSTYTDSIDSNGSIERLVNYHDALAAFNQGGYDGLAFAPTRGCGVVACKYTGAVKRGRIHDDAHFMCKDTYFEYALGEKSIQAFVNSVKVSSQAKPIFDELTPTIYGDSGAIPITGKVENAWLALGWKNALKTV